jgi:prevent-host-death family protein
MSTFAATLSVRELREQLSDVIGRTSYGHERVGITRNGKLAAVVVGIDDLRALEELEMAADIAAYDEAKNEDDGYRISLDELRTKLGR